ncbi:hypothetical protein MTR_5g029630 [Medicago truncatula]|uniref:Uncharacterized protein n=1 Tax=Medicago truncatula TaxID=3880 RepID=G7KCF1_MEDTR|nr:hypothetical protein MTR_5g029630 [Medicago truncatula]
MNFFLKTDSKCTAWQWGGWGRVLHSPSPYLIHIYLPVTLPIPNGDEKMNPIPVLDGFKYPRPIPVPGRFHHPVSLGTCSGSTDTQDGSLWGSMGAIPFLKGVEGFFGTLMPDGSNVTSRKLKHVMFFMSKCGACI